MLHRILVFLTFVLMIPVQSESATLLSDLIEQLRGRAGVSADTTAAFTNTDAMHWLNQAQNKIVKIGDYIPKHTDIVWLESDSLGYVLPSDFRVVDQAVIRSGLVWRLVLENPGFAHDTTAPQFFVKRQNADTALIYSKNIYMESQLVRLFYRGTASQFTALTDTVEVQVDRHVFIIEEAYAMYLQSERLFQEAQVNIALSRQDMGLVSQREGDQQR